MNERYPIVTNIVPSQATANILKNLLFEQNGILTAHLSYMYQSWHIAPKEKVFGDYLAKLADNDGQILNALGNIAVAFGGDPNFMTSNVRNWSTQYLLVSQNRDNFLRSAIQMEERSIISFDNAIAAVENTSLKTLLTSIKEDKQKIIQDLKHFMV